MRLFFAVELDAAVRAAAVFAAERVRERLGADARSFRWLRPEALHVTLRFLGEQDAAVVPALCARVVCEVAAERCFELELGRALAFPKARRPSVLALEVTPEALLSSLAAAVQRGTRAAGFEPEAREFRPHLTLARVRRGRRIRSTLSADIGLADPVSETASPQTASPQTGFDAARRTQAASMRVAEVVLFQSELRPDGARYTPIERLALGANDHPSTDSTEDGSNGTQKA